MSSRCCNEGTMLWIGLYTGMRPSEILGLTWDRIDFKKMEITVDRQISRDPKKIFADHLKTQRAHRTIPLAQELASLIKNHVQNYGLGPHDLLFKNRTGGVWRYKDALNIMRDYGRKAGLNKGEGIHILRHTFASIAIQAGVNAKQLQATLGHGSIVDTYDTYGHLFPNDLSNCLDSVAKSLSDNTMKELAN